MSAVAKDLGFDELFGLGDVDGLLAKAKTKCDQKLQGKKFAGMETEDVVQEVLIKVHRSLDQYDPEKAKVSTFIDHVIENMIKDCYKRCGAEKNLMLVNAMELVDSSSDLGDEEITGWYASMGEVDTGYLQVDITTDIALNLKLTNREHEVFELRTQGYEFVEIADIMGISKARISQIWKVIKEKYDRG